VLRVGREVDALDGGMRRQPGRDFAGVGALALHAQREGLDAAHRQIGFERAEGEAESAESARSGARCVLVGDHDAAEHVAVSGKVFGQAVDRHRRAEFQRAVISGVAKVLSTISGTFGFAGHGAMRSRRERAAAGWRWFPSRSRRAGVRRWRSNRVDRRNRRRRSSTPAGSKTFVSMPSVAP
jgi:hypothetical protein